MFFPLFTKMLIFFFFNAVVDFPILLEHTREIRSGVEKEACYKSMKGLKARLLKLSWLTSVFS